MRLCAAEEEALCVGYVSGRHRLCDEHVDWAATRLGLPPLRLALVGVDRAPPDFDTVLAVADRRARWDGLTAEQVRLVKGVRPEQTQESTACREGRSG